METKNNLKKSILNNITIQIVIAMLLGAILGVIIHNNYIADDAKNFSDKIKMLATVFIRLVQMIIPHWYLQLWLLE